MEFIPTLTELCKLAKCNMEPEEMLQTCSAACYTSNENSLGFEGDSCKKTLVATSPMGDITCQHLAVKLDESMEGQLITDKTQSYPRVAGELMNVMCMLNPEDPQCQQ